ncbi:hypothetical protein PVIIG_05428 [Plasmodium vivax India VII]|uniref:Secreted ookinete protein n=1 Tax=Plasmodium vivax India VII TaxID=1077284 RepID=A0A0J9V9W8_PLAVI|nr:hypothetical protein PVIIG_05428 [Plasmodium vivax India VII]
MQIVRILLFSLLIAASSPTSSSKSPHSNPQKEKPTGKNEDGSKEAPPAEESNHGSDDQRGENEGGEDSLGEPYELDDGATGPPRGGADEGGGRTGRSGDQGGRENEREGNSNGRGVFGSLLSFLNGGNFGDYASQKQVPFHPEEGHAKGEASHEEKLTSHFINTLESSERRHTVGGSIPFGRKSKAKQCSYSHALFGQLAKKKTILDRSLEEESNVGESAPVEGEHSPFGDDHQGEDPQGGGEAEAEKVEEPEWGGEAAQEGDHFGDDHGDHFGDDHGDHFGDDHGDLFGDDHGAHFGNHSGDHLGDPPVEEGEGEGTRDFFNFEKEFMKREEEKEEEKEKSGGVASGGAEDGGAAEQVGEREANVSSHNGGGAKGRAGKKKGPSDTEQKKKKRSSAGEVHRAAMNGASGVSGVGGVGDVGGGNPGEETDEPDELLINKPEAIKYFFEVLTEVCVIIKLGVVHRFTHVVIPIKNIIVSKTLRQIEVVLRTMLSVHRLGSHKYRDTYGLGIIALLLYLLTYLINRCLYKGGKKRREEHSERKPDDVYLVNLLKRILYVVESRKTGTNADEGVLHDVLYNTETLLATSNIINKENKQIYTDIIGSINNLGIFTYVSTQALKSINQKADLLISGFAGGKAARPGGGQEEEEEALNLEMMDLDMGGSAIGGTSLGGGALGVSLGAALGRRGFPNGVEAVLPNGMEMSFPNGVETGFPNGAIGHMVDDAYDVGNMQNNFGDDPLYGENSVRSKMRYGMVHQHNEEFEEGDLLAYSKGTASYGFVGEGQGANGGGDFPYEGVDAGGSAANVMSGANFPHFGHPKQGGDFLKEDLNSRSSFSHVSKPSNQMNGDEVTNEDGGKTSPGRSRAVDPPPPPAMAYMSSEHLPEGFGGAHSGQQSGQQISTPAAPPASPTVASPAGPPLPPPPMFPFGHVHPNGEVHTKKTSAGLSAGPPEKGTDSGDGAFPVHGSLNMMGIAPPEDALSSAKKDDVANHVAGPQAPFFEDPPSGAAAPPKKDSLQNYAPPPQLMEITASRNQKYLTQRK